ncbi:unnamed protein product [Heterobilharzia americana]|nr:unnamed protein product [Heterobilharzia americana]
MNRSNNLNFVCGAGYDLKSSPPMLNDLLQISNNQPLKSTSVNVEQIHHYHHHTGQQPSPSSPLTPQPKCLLSTSNVVNQVNQPCVSQTTINDKFLIKTKVDFNNELTETSKSIECVAKRKRTEINAYYLKQILPICDSKKY